MRVVPVVLLIIAAALIAGIAFGHAADAGHAATSVSWSLEASADDPGPDHGDADSCAALCATADASTPVRESTVTGDTQLEGTQPTVAIVAIPIHPSPEPPSLLGLLGILRI